MKKFYLLVAFMLCISQSIMAQITNPAPYCASSFGNNYNMWNYMKVNGTNHSFGPVGSWISVNTYKYYNDVVFPSIAAGSTIALELMPYAPNDGEPIYFGVFIDFNKNNVFDADEFVMRNNNTTNAALPIFGAATTAITKNIVVPAGTAAGTYRMRLIRAGKSQGQNIYVYDNAYNVISCDNGDYGCTYDFNIDITSNLAVNDIKGQEENSLRIYPNPVKDYLNISNPKKGGIKKVSIYSASGQMVYQENTKNQHDISINVSGLSDGVYFVNTETSTSKYTNKFIKE